MAQAPPGPLPVPPQSSDPRPPRPVAARPKPPEIPPRKTLDGLWKLNQDQSDDTRRKIQDSRGQTPIPAVAAATVEAIRAAVIRAVGVTPEGEAIRVAVIQEAVVTDLYPEAAKRPQRTGHGD